MITLHLKDSEHYIVVNSEDALFAQCRCGTLPCRDCPFGPSCGIDFSALTFGEAMELCKERIDELVDHIEGIGDEINEKPYTFEFTDKEVVFLQALMNVWEPNGITKTLTLLDFFNTTYPPFIKEDANDVPLEWSEGDIDAIVGICHRISEEIYTKLKIQRGL